MSEDDVARKLTQLGKHTLERTVHHPQCTIYRMAEPGTRMMSVVLVFLHEPEERILITGDIMMGPGNGLISNLGYGERWFAGRNGASYLAEKFLREEYVPDIAIAWAKDKLAELRDEFIDSDGRFIGTDDEIEIARDRIEELEEAILQESKFETSESFYSFYEEICGDGPSEGEGQGYNPATQAWLCAIQQRFAELHAQLVQSEPSLHQSISTIH